MAKLDLCVKIPEIPGLITRKIVRGGVYIYYEYSREYFADRKYTPTHQVKMSLFHTNKWGKRKTKF